MKTKMIWANYATSNLERTTKFYTEIGFKPNGKPNNELTSFKVGDNDFVIHFFIKEKLLPDLKGNLIDATQGNEIIFTLSASSKSEVNDWATTIEKTGGTMVSQPEEFGEGYYGFVFADPDGHKFNIFYMEGL